MSAPDNQSIIAMLEPRNKSAEGRKKDLLVEITGYDLKHGVMHVKDAENVAFTARINPNKQVTSDNTYAFEGNKIDSRMERTLPIGSKVVLQGAIDYGVRDQNKPLNTDWVMTTPVDPNKLVSGILSAVPYTDRQSGEEKVGKVLRWSTKAFSEADFSSPMFNRVSEMMDRGAQYSEEATRRREAGEPPLAIKPHLGFQFRAVDRSKGEIVELSNLVDYNPTAKRPPNTQDFKDCFNWFKQHINDKFQDPNVQIEVTMYNTYRGSKNFDVTPNVRNLTHTGMNIAHDQPSQILQGGILAGEGFIKLSTGKVDPRTGQRSGEQNDFANSIIASGRKYPAQTMIPDTGGNYLKVSPSLPIFASDGQVLTFEVYKSKQQTAQQQAPSSPQEVDKGQSSKSIRDMVNAELASRSEAPATQQTNSKAAASDSFADAFQRQVSQVKRSTQTMG